MGLLLPFILQICVYGKPYRIATQNLEPLVYCTPGEIGLKNFTGYSIDLMAAIAEELDWPNGSYEFEWMRLDQVYSEIRDGDSDFGIGGLRAATSTYDDFLFSYSTYNSGLMLVVTKTSRSTLWLLFEPLEPMLWVAAALTGLLMAHIIWIVERGNDGEFPMEYSKGISESIWHSFSSFFFTGDKEIRTLPGRIMQTSYWFMAFVLFSAYTANLVTRLSISPQSQTIYDYEDLEGMEIGALMPDRQILEQYGADVSTFEQEDIKDAITRLKDGDYDVIAIDSPIAHYYVSRDCDLLTAGEIFVPFQYVIYFPKDADQELINDINYANAKLNQLNKHRSLRNKNIYKSGEENCNEIYGKSIHIADIAGLWIILGACIITGVPIYIYYNRRNANRRNMHISENQEEAIKKKKAEEAFKLDRRAAAEIDLMSKFDKICCSSEKKFKQKLKDLENSLAHHSGSADEFEDALKDLCKRLEHIIS